MKVKVAELAVRPLEEIQVLQGAEPLGPRARIRSTRCSQRDLGMRRTRSASSWSNAKETYTVEATDGGGKSLSKATFTPKTVEREYLDKFPGWSRVIVTTGWLSAVGDAHRRRRTDRDRSRAVLGSLPVDGAAAHLRQRDEGQTAIAAARQAAVPSRPRRRGLDERARLQDWRRRGAGLVARGAARGSLFRDARFLRRARPDDDAAAAGGARQDLSDHPSRSARASRERCTCCTRATPRRSRSIEISYKEKGIEKPTKVSRDLAKIDTSATVGSAPS